MGPSEVSVIDRFLLKKKKENSMNTWDLLNNNDFTVLVLCVSIPKTVSDCASEYGCALINFELL